MKFAPLAAFAAMASILAIKGGSILKTFGLFIGEFYIGLFLLWILLIFITLTLLLKVVATGITLGSGGNGGGVAVFSQFQQRIGFQFLGDVLGKLNRRQLQQFDRLLQLRRDDQALGLSQI